MLSARELSSLRAEARDLCLQWHLRNRGAFLDDTQEMLSLVQASAEIVTTAEQSLLRWVGAARARGASWQDVGDVLGITRQAAQKRFGDGVPPPPSPPLRPDVVVVQVESSTDEIAVLTERGADGFLLTDVGPQMFVFAQVGSPVQHRRVPALDAGPTEADFATDGWQVAARAYPFVYLARTVPGDG